MVDSKNHSSIARNVHVEQEVIPAQRGVIIARDGTVLTNNVQSADVVVDRHYMRELTVVVGGLAYSHAVHDPRWAATDDPVEHQKIWSEKRDALLKNARLQIGAEEKAALRRKVGANDARSNRMMEYDEAMCAHYYEQHDKLVAELLYPFLCNQEVPSDNPDEPKRLITREDIVERIAQTATCEYNAKAAAEGRPTRSLRNDIVLAKGVDMDTAERIKEMLAQTHVRGITVRTRPSRLYSVPDRLCHVLGYVDYENRGVSGLESVYDSYLVGRNGVREYRRNARGQVLPSTDDRYLKPQDGLSLRLTIDMKLQSICEEALDWGLATYRAERGCMIAVDPKTGDVLAMVSRPAFDLNTKKVLPMLGKKNPPSASADFNYACQTRYEPGSVFKVLSVTAALDLKLRSIHDTIDCSPFYVTNSSKSRVSDGNNRNYGRMPVWGVLKKSSNPGAVNLARMCKWSNYKMYYQRFGLNAPTGLPLPSGPGMIEPRGTNALDFSRIAYGYSVLVSPMHMAMVYATIANKGVRMKPRLVSDIIAPDGSVYKHIGVEVAEKVMRPSTAADICMALETVTEQRREGPGVGGARGAGTATLAAIPGFRIGGKTGTARKVKNGTYLDGRYVVSFAGVLPINDPRVVIMTVIDDPRPPGGSVGGGTVAAPIFRMAAERIIEELKIPPSDPKAYETYLMSKKRTAAVP